MDELSEHAILWNTAALTSLKRQQLMSLSKRYGLKASGKNTEMVQRLHDFGQALTPSTKAVFDLETQNPPESPTKSPSKPMPASEDLEPPQAPALTRLKNRSSATSLARRGSWQVIDHHDASLVVEDEEGDDTTNWKSAANGAPLDGDKGEKYGSLRGVGSLRSIASSIRRTASRTLSTKEKSPTPNIVFPGSASDVDQPEPEQTEEILCPSPASTVGVPKRIREDGTHHRSSTIRPVSPSESMANLVETNAERDALPLTGPNSVARIKERRSMKPLAATPQPALKDRPSLPTILSPATDTRGIYPQIPAFDHTAPLEVQAAMGTPEPEMPGSFPGSPASPSFVFGTAQAVSANEFSDAGAKLLAEFQAKMGGVNIFSSELLKGKDAEVSKLVSSTSMGFGTMNSVGGSTASSGAQKKGFGLAPGPEANDRYAAAHRREFQRMKSLQSMPGTSSRSASGTSQMKPSASSSKLGTAVAKRQLDEPAPESERGSKRSKPAPAQKPGLIDAFRRSRVTSASKSPVKAMGRGGIKGAVGRFGFLRHKKTASGNSIPSPAKSPDSISSEGSYVLPPVNVPEDKADKMSRLKKMSSKPGLRDVKASAPPRMGGRSVSAATAASTGSSETTLSLSSRRGPIPDFGLHKPTFQPLKDNSQDHGSTSSRASGASAPPAMNRQMSASSTGSITRSGAARNLARAASTDLQARSFASGRQLSSSNPPASNMRSPSSSNLRSPSVSNLRSPSITNLRSPSITNLRSPSMSSIPRSRSSTLLAPTASSMARRQATVRPSPNASTSATGEVKQRRPLPRPPTSVPTGLTPNMASLVVQPFGEASSRANFLFESNFHISPTPNKLSAGSSSLMSPTKRGLGPKSPRRTAAGVRARASGLNAIKAAGHTDNAAVARRRTEFRGKQERLAQEKELRMMLG
ncbi:hypothetical protein CspeluHIS016_0308830 [Cutaneotrichosporon spelunceum]|uniref:SAP domain-containing protein n=1 Tax=Cutaneotrichosporon spelunceum TaxID=1672016 RepID=A0AAD3TUE1_9TREE|nr:hypothetical protein CspeluHIS016_0308830 [Cutaneotrichosporon spelunceum]